MNEPVNRRPEDILAEMESCIHHGFAQGRTDTVAVAGDPAHAMDILGGVRPGASAIVIFYQSDVAVGEEGIEGDTLVEATASVAVVQHPGLELKPATKPSNALVSAGELRAFITNISIDGALGGISYRGMDHLRNYAGEILHGYVLRFTFAYAYKL